MGAEETDGISACDAGTARSRQKESVRPHDGGRGGWRGLPCGSRKVDILLLLLIQSLILAAVDIDDYLCCGVTS